MFLQSNLEEQIDLEPEHLREIDYVKNNETCDKLEATRCYI